MSEKELDPAIREAIGIFIAENIAVVGFLIVALVIIQSVMLFLLPFMVYSISKSNKIIAEKMDELIAATRRGKLTNAIQQHKSNS